MNPAYNNRTPHLIALFIAICFSCFSCGYTTRGTLPGHLRTIYVEPFKNSVAYTTETNRQVYLPLLEVNVRNAVINRYLLDGYLKIADPEKADLILKGELKGFQRDELRTSDNEDVEEYRITITVSLELKDTVKNEIKWTEPSFSGDATYALTGSLAKSESTAIDEAIKDLARRVVERTFDDW